MSTHNLIKKPSISNLQSKKLNQQKLSMLTCYDFTFAQIINQTAIDMLLVGDSGVMTQLGYPDTTHATIEMMCFMTQSVVKGAPDKFIIADMPFLAQRQGIAHAIHCADRLIKCGANAIKIEGINGHQDVVKHIIESGIPVMGHIGLTPQSVHTLGYKVQGKDDRAAKSLKQQALQLQEVGCFSLVMECVPSGLAKEISQMLTIPVIGIGAGNDVDGQVLVIQDMLGLNNNLQPKFVRHFFNGFSHIKAAFDTYHQAVQTGDYPNKQERYDIKIA
ncbi:3-methyl-2-oxobutanoate hydroxymethyltransferase [Cysteiniphilum halobium]|uniref:3-methyl-2-oxobutanoate hydroxymethyltransferase n=1 Tax=Cysteiniphilum halobium TaxID=2219059 RepID=UPI000E648DF5|nr:3-methyl-2-oxobutanoate hydroxymethyltransferase [Cysteiniphilum halobium]